MPRLVAFLRGINVSGHKVIRMADLVETFEDAGARDVSSFQAAGNVAFRWRSTDPATAARTIRRAVEARHGSGTAVLVRPVDRLRELVRRDPFGTSVAEGDTAYVTFFDRPPDLVAPQRSPRGDIDLLLVDGAEAFSLARRVDGRPGFPNAYLEKTTGLEATTRNWATVRGLVEKEAAPSPPPPPRARAMRRRRT